MACSKYTITNTGDTQINFNYRRCDDSMWEYQIPLDPNQTKNIWLMNDTFSIAKSYDINTLLVDNGVFPPVFVTPTPTPTVTTTPSNTPTITSTPTVTQTNTGTPNVTSTPTATIGLTPTATETQTPTPSTTAQVTPTPTPSTTAQVTPTPTPSTTAQATPTPTPTNTGTSQVTPTPTATLGLTPTATETQTPTPSITAQVTQTPTPTNTQTGTPNVTSTPTNTSTQTPTPTSTPTLAYFGITNGDVSDSSIIVAVTINSVAITGPQPGNTPLPIYYPVSTLYTTSQVNTTTNVVVSMTASPSGPITLYIQDSNFNIQCLSVTGSGNYTFNNVYIQAGTSIGIYTDNDICPTPTPTNTPTNTLTPTITPTNTSTPAVTPTNTTTPTPTQLPSFNVLYIGGSNAELEATSIKNYLQTTGYNMTYSAVTLDTLYTGDGGITTGNYDTVVMYTTDNVSGSTYSSSLSTALYNYVSGGGNFVSGARLWWSYPSGFNHSELTAFNVNNTLSTVINGNTIWQNQIFANPITSGLTNNGFGTSVTINGASGSQMVLSTNSKLINRWGISPNVSMIGFKKVSGATLVSLNSYVASITSFTSSTMNELYGNCILFSLGYLGDPYTKIEIINIDTSSATTVTGVTVSGASGSVSVGQPTTGDGFPLSSGQSNNGFQSTQWGNPVNVIVDIDIPVPPSGTLTLDWSDSSGGNYGTIPLTSSGSYAINNVNVGNLVTGGSFEFNITINYTP